MQIFGIFIEIRALNNDLPTMNSNQLMVDIDH